MEDHITHEGVVQKVSENSITVVIINASACASCHAHGACLASDMKEKEIDINRFTGHYHIGQKVIITGRTTQALKAVFYGYLLPSVLVLTTLFTGIFLIKNEGLAALLALGVLVPYYASLNLLKKYFKRSFEFEISPINN